MCKGFKPARWRAALTNADKSPGRRYLNAVCVRVRDDRARRMEWRRMVGVSAKGFGVFGVSAKGFRVGF